MHVFLHRKSASHICCDWQRRAPYQEPRACIICADMGDLCNADVQEVYHSDLKWIECRQVDNDAFLIKGRIHEDLDRCGPEVS